MYSNLQLTRKYFQYLWKASNGKGHGTHSPFVFDFITKILNDKKKLTCYEQIELRRKYLLKDDSIIEIEELGAGSRSGEPNKRSISSIAGSALKSKKYSRLLSRMVQYYHSGKIMELGTCLGITTCYLACGNRNAQVYTMEGARQVASVAKDGFQNLDYTNIDLIEGNFDDTLPLFVQDLQSKHQHLDFVFVDGNHREEPTLRYFHQLLPVLGAGSVVVFDDIHWSAEMERAWAAIKDADSVTLSIDLFFLGIVFFRDENKVKQHFTIRF